MLKGAEQRLQLRYRHNNQNLTLLKAGQKPLRPIFLAIEILDTERPRVSGDVDEQLYDGFYI